MESESLAPTEIEAELPQKKVEKGEPKPKDVDMPPPRAPTPPKKPEAAPSVAGQESELGDSVSVAGADGPIVKDAAYWKMYRYFNPKGGKVKASPETMRLWKTKGGSNLHATSKLFGLLFHFVFFCSFGPFACAVYSLGAELKRLFLEHGSFETVEVLIKKRYLKSKEAEHEGGWYTKQYLTAKEGWSKRGPQLDLDP